MTKPQDALAGAICTLDQMAAFFHHWTSEARNRALAGDSDGALAALKGADSLLAEMAATCEEIRR